MSERMNALAQLLGKSSVEECTLEELQQLTNQYPYFVPAQFLLLQKLKADGSADFEAQHSKAVLYYNDPLQFEAFVSPEKFRIDETLFAKNPFIDPSAANAANIDTVHQTETSLTDEQSSFEENEESEEINDVIALEEISQPEDTISNEPAIAEDSEAIETENANLDVTPSPIETSPVQAQREENLEETSETTGNQSAEENSENEETIWPSATPQTLPEPEMQDAVSATETGQAESKHLTAATVLHVSEKTAKTNESPLVFEPYYTVDYFASQGIKPSAETLPKDKLGRQLKSFTEWLRTMKRLPAGEMSKTPESPVEKTIENMASHSVADSDVVTEAMAEVWTKQGHPEKAIETYNKLSLLIPAKKAYFAAKIENLKQS